MTSWPADEPSAGSQNRGMRVFIGALATETNTYAPFPTAWTNFAENGIRRDASKAGCSLVGELMREFRECAEADGCEVIETISAFAQPSGRTIKSVYEGLREMILADLAAAGPLDIILLMLHGAMVAHGYEDCEGDLLERVRKLAPDAVIGTELDPHCHMTAAMLDNSDLVILAKEYPHIDFNERARELYTLCRQTALGQIRPLAALVDTRMIGFYPTFDSPMKEIVAEVQQLEAQDGILSASIVHGFPWADVAAVGTKVLVYSNDDQAIATAGATRIADLLYGARHALAPNYPDLDSALDAASGMNGQVVLGDFADNAGGGAPSDSTFFLRALIDRGITDAAIGAFWDPQVARVCADAGTGAVLDVRLGGKCGPASGDPLDLTVKVCNVVEDHGQTMFGGRQPFGLSVWLHVAGIDVVVSSLRSQVFERDAFTGLGIPLHEKRLVVVKSSNHYRSGFEAEADHLQNVRTPGAMQLDFSGIDYASLDGVYFPRIDDPWAVKGRPDPFFFRSRHSTSFPGSV